MGRDYSRQLLVDKDFSDEDLSGSLFCGAVMHRCRFTRADLTGADFGEAEIRQTWFAGARLGGANFSKGQFIDCRFDWAELKATKWTDAEIERSAFNHASMKGLDLRSVKFQSIALAGSETAPTDLSEADLSGLDLSRSSCSFINFSLAILRRVNFGQPYEADLSGTNFTGADLTGADLTDVNIDDDTCFSGANLRLAKIAFTGENTGLWTVRYKADGIYELNGPNTEAAVIDETTLHGFKIGEPSDNEDRR